MWLGPSVEVEVALEDWVRASVHRDEGLSGDVDLVVWVDADGDRIDEAGYVYVGMRDDEVLVGDFEEFIEDQLGLWTVNKRVGIGFMLDGYGGPCWGGRYACREERKDEEGQEGEVHSKPAMGISLEKQTLLAVVSDDQNE
jgi:hypothetical protein